MARFRCAAVLALGLTVLLAGGVDAAEGFQTGNPELSSAGPMAFGPEGVLFLADPKAATIVAVDTQDTGDRSAGELNVENIDQKVASLLGTSRQDVSIEDLAVNPASGKVYLSVSRGRGPDAQPVVLRLDSAGKVSEFPLEKVRYSKAKLPNAPEDRVVGEGRRRQNNRLFSITDLSFIDGRVIVAGLSNEEFASNLRAISYPFSEVDEGASIEIFHGNHGRLETRSPVRTFIPITLGGQPQIVAAYTCTPLVRIPLSELKPGAKVTGTTVAELGNRNRPLDIIAYEQNGQGYLLMANDRRGVMKIPTEGLDEQEAITQPVEGKAGQPYETVESLQGVTQLDRYNDKHAIVLVETDSGQHLRTVPLP